MPGLDSSFCRDCHSKATNVEGSTSLTQGLLLFKIVACYQKGIQSENGERAWMSVFAKEICIYPKSMWKDAQRHNSPGSWNLKHNKLPLPWTSEGQVLGRLCRKLNPHTKLVASNLVTSITTNSHMCYVCIHVYMNVCYYESTIYSSSGNILRHRGVGLDAIAVSFVRKFPENSGLEMVTLLERTVQWVITKIWWKFWFASLLLFNKISIAFI